MGMNCTNPAVTSPLAQPIESQLRQEPFNLQALPKRPPHLMPRAVNQGEGVRLVTSVVTIDDYGVSISTSHRIQVANAALFHQYDLFIAELSRSLAAPGSSPRAAETREVFW